MRQAQHFRKTGYRFRGRHGILAMLPRTHRKPHWHGRARWRMQISWQAQHFRKVGHSFHGRRSTFTRSSKISCCTFARSGTDFVKVVEEASSQKQLLFVGRQFVTFLGGSFPPTPQSQLCDRSAETLTASNWRPKAHNNALMTRSESLVAKFLRELLALDLLATAPRTMR